MIRAKWIVALFAGASVLGGLTAYRWHHPCAVCPISMAICALGGPSGCAKTPEGTRMEVVKTDAAPAQAATSDSVAVKPASTTTDQTPMNTTAKTETAMFGAGCFWGVEAIFRKQPGVVDAAVGYAGGSVRNPTYKQVCTDTTGHAEVVKIEFDPTKVSYEQLVDLFFRLHDPTQLDRQGPDYGSQYRSAIFSYSPEQQKTAEAVKARRQASGKHKGEIVTEISKAPEFWRAEEYHQRYLEKSGKDNCHIPSAD